MKKNVKRKDLLKRAQAMLLAAVMTVSLAACANGGTYSGSKERGRGRFSRNAGHMGKLG
jgi:outer membrane lipoprotein SlyB